MPENNRVRLLLLVEFRYQSLNDLIQRNLGLPIILPELIRRAILESYENQRALMAEAKRSYSRRPKQILNDILRSMKNVFFTG